MSRFTLGRVLPLAALALTAGACSDSGGPSNPAQVSFNVATQAAPTAAGGSLAIVGTPETFTDGTNTLIVNSVQLVLREIELHKAGVASECAEAADDDCEELEIGPDLVDLPLGTPGGARTLNVALQPGSYDRVELEIHKPSSSSDAAFIQAHPDFDGVSVLASVAHLQGRSDEAAALYRGALLAYQRLGDRRGTAETYHNLGFAYRQAGEWREAEAATANAVRHAEVVGEPALVALVLGAKAELSVERADTALAERELERAVRYAIEAGDEVGRAEVHRVEALNALHRQEWESALFHAEIARNVAVQHDSALWPRSVPGSPRGR